MPPSFKTTLCPVQPRHFVPHSVQDKSDVKGDLYGLKPVSNITESIAVDMEGEGVRKAM